MTALRAAFEILFAVAIVLAVPRWIGSWSLLMFGVPDLAWWLLVASGLTMATGLARGTLLARELVRTTDRATPPSSQPGARPR